MIKSFFIAIIVLFFSVSCSKDDAETFNARVLEQGIDCGTSYLIQFYNNAEGLPYESENNIYYEINLPEAFKVADKEVLLTFREPIEDELMVCTMAGPSYRQLYIVSAQ